MLFVSDDRFMDTVMGWEARFGGLALTALPPTPVIATIMDKSLQLGEARRHGIDAPETLSVSSVADVPAVVERLGLPLLVKAKRSREWRERLAPEHHKGTVVSSVDGLRVVIDRCAAAGLEALAQEIVPGAETGITSVFTYIARDGRVVAYLTRRKIRQYPPNFGTFSLMASTDDQETAAAGLGLLTAIGATGINSVEFKRDARDGRLKLMEISPRYPMSMSLAAASGVDLALVHYLDVTGQHPPPGIVGRPDVRCVDVAGEIRSFRYYRRTIGVRAWLRELRGERVYSTFAWDDPLPLLAELAAFPGWWLRRRRNASGRPDRLRGRARAVRRRR